MYFRNFVLCVAFVFCAVGALLAQHPLTPNAPSPAPKQTHFDPETVARGHAQFKSSCGFCHGEDASGSRAPDLIRSATLSHDVDGDRVGPVIRNGRPDKGMPAFGDLKETQISDIVTFLHSQAYEAAHSAHVPGDYPLAKLLTGNAELGKAFFNGAGGCGSCHSTTGDLAGIASKVKPVDLQQRFVYPNGPNKKTAVITLPDGGTAEGLVKQDDEFIIAIVAKDGWYRSWPKSEVKVELRDPLEAHRELVTRYTDADMHNIFAYLETLK